MIQRSTTMRSGERFVVLGDEKAIARKREKFAKKAFQPYPVRPELFEVAENQHLYIKAGEAVELGDPFGAVPAIESEEEPKKGRRR